MSALPKDLAVIDPMITDIVGDSVGEQRIIDLIRRWLSQCSNEAELLNHIKCLESEGKSLLKDLCSEGEVNYDPVNLGLTETAWTVSIFELISGVRYYQTSLCNMAEENSFPLSAAGSIEENQSKYSYLLMLKSLRELLSAFQGLSSTAITSFGLVYLGWVLLLSRQVLTNRLSASQYAISIVSLTQSFHHRVVSSKSALLRQHLPQQLTARVLGDLF